MKLIDFDYNPEKAIQAALNRYVQESGALGGAMIITFPDGTQKKFAACDDGCFSGERKWS